jgi:cbb3-type cytochrome oxidase maturation protein
MDVLYLLVPMSVLAMLGILAVFAWALHGGQFDEIDAVGAQILETSDAALDVGQGPSQGAPEESPGPESQCQRSSP